MTSSPRSGCCSNLVSGENPHAGRGGQKPPVAEKASSLAFRCIETNSNAPRLHTFSATFETVPDCDERPYIHAVLDSGGFEPHFLHADQISPLTDWERMSWHEDEPLAAPNLYMHWGLFHLASQQNVHVVLDGLDGDTTVSHGRYYLAELLRYGHWITLIREIRAIGRNFERPPAAILRRFALPALAPASLIRLYRRLRGQRKLYQRIYPAIRQDFVQ
jgi:hypothetical protein